MKKYLFVAVARGDYRRPSSLHKSPAVPYIRRFLFAFGLLIVAAPVWANEPGDQKTSAPPAVAPAAPQSATLPTVDQILEKLATALGGREAMARLTAITLKGRIEVPGASVSGRAEMNVKAPNKVAFEASFPAQNYSKRQVFDGTTGWECEQRPGGTPTTRQITGLELESLRREADIYRYFKLREFYPEMKLIGRTMVDDREAYEIEATTPEGRVEKMYFDASSGLLLVNDAATIRDGQAIPYRIYYDDYRKVAGLMLPFTYTMFSPTDDNDVSGIILRFQDVRANGPLPDSLFAQPR